MDVHDDEDDHVQCMSDTHNSDRTLPEKGADNETEYDSLDMLERVWKETLATSCEEQEVMMKCLQFCFLFPKNYEFHKDDMIQLWMAQGFFPLPSNEETSRGLIEDTARLLFEEFERAHIFRLSQLDYSDPQLRYRLNHSIFHLLQERHPDEYARIGDSKSNISENTLHCSLPESSISPIAFENLYRAKRLLTLLILHDHGSCSMHQVPRQLFLRLPSLRVLDFSHTNISVLPNSIGNLKDLRYLNLSGTPITMLPDALCSLSQVQTLKLRTCLKLVSLPDDMRKLINLRHLDLDLACLLVSMPTGLGDLTKLQSLPAFAVGRENGCHITELQHMVNLGGTLRILGLENVSNSQEAKEAALDEKKIISKLEFQWTVPQDAYEVLENLKPHTDIEELQIVGYGSATFPRWIGDRLFFRLGTITFHDCRKCELLPPLGKLPFLYYLCMSEIHQVKVIDHHFCGRSLESGTDSANSNDLRKFSAFPRLEKLTLNGLPKLKKWTGTEVGDFPCLQKINISGCSKLTALTELSVCKSLQLLEISVCSSLESFPDKGLPSSLEYLVIIDCPLLTEWCHRDKGGMLARIPTVWIDYQQIFLETASNQTQNMFINSASTPTSMPPPEDFGHQAGSSNSAIILPSGTDLLSSSMEQTKSMHYSTITSPMSLPTSDTGGSSVQAPQQLEEIIPMEVTELQPHLDGNKKLKDVEIPKRAPDMDSKTQPKAFETSSDDDAEYEGATTGRPVKQIVELRLEQLYDSLANQSHKSSSFQDEFDEMMKKLDVMRSFLNQISTDEEDPMVERISAQIREFVYEADDIVLDCQIRADYDEVFRLTIERKLSYLNKRAEGIEMRINDLNEYGDPKNQMSLTRNKGYIGSTSARRVSHGRSYSKAIGLIEDILIEDVQKIKGWIFTNEKSPQIAITGRGGLGKTTIARTIFKDYYRQGRAGYFEKLIWVTVSTPFSETDILRSFLIQLGMGYRVNSHDEDAMSHIKTSLYNKKYLIVMEDVQEWRMNYDWWRMLLENLPAEGEECNRRIIITTTDDEVARNMGVTYFHRARNLDENESWFLFCELAFSADQKRNLNYEFETVGKDIVKKCKGILLAIKAVAGLLATKTVSSVQWEVVNSNFRVNNNESIVDTILELSYDDLPAMLKHCILCFSIYPPGTVIYAEQLIYWWVGEGFVHGDDRKTAIEVAFQCLSQLVSRCLVEVDHYRGYDGRIYECRMHKLVRDFIIEKSRIEGFSSSGGEGFYCRHLGYTSKMDKEILGNNSKLRAFLSMEDVSPLKLDTGPDRIKSLRVLDLSLGGLGVDVVDLLSFIESQKRLAYLNLTGVGDLTELPDWIKEHRNLKILVLNYCYNLETLPPSITTLHNLLVLDVTDCDYLKLPPGFGGLTKLQVLRGFRLSLWQNNLAELRELKNLAELRELTIDLDIFFEIGDGEEYFLSQLSKLKVLTIRNVRGTIVNKLKPPPSLKELNLEYCMDTNTPDWLTPASLPKLVYLNIDGGDVEGVNPSFWEGNGEGWRIEGLRFNYLRRFKLDWEVVKSNMKYLRYAEVGWCPGLKSFPLGANNYGVLEKEEESE